MRLSGTVARELMMVACPTSSAVSRDKQYGMTGPPPVMKDVTTYVGIERAKERPLHRDADWDRAEAGDGEFTCCEGVTCVGPAIVPPMPQVRCRIRTGVPSPDRRSSVPRALRGSRSAGR